MSDSVKFSIITSVFNNREFIAEAIDSVLGQSYKNVEYIVIDGGSSDGTQGVVTSYGDKISKFISKKDSGIYDGLNKGLEQASGDVIGFLHSDDLYASSDVLAAVAKIFIDNPDIDGVYGDLVYTKKEDPDSVIRYWKSSGFTPTLLKKGWMPPHPTLFLKKSVYERYGRFSLDFKIAADYDFMLRVLSGGVKVLYLPKTLYKMRVGGASNKSIKNIIRKSREDLEALRRNKIGGLTTLLMKNFSKLGQFFKR